MGKTVGLTKKLVEERNKAAAEKAKESKNSSRKTASDDTKPDEGSEKE